jgi:hypothetical protein
MSVQQIHSQPLKRVVQEISAADRERALWIASGRYMRNEISVEQLEEAERPHVENLKRSVLRIALRRLFKP